MEYEEFLRSKHVFVEESGFEVDTEKINGVCFPWQKDIIKWAVKLGRACIFSYTGTGKTIMQLEWARIISEMSGENVIIVSPLAVACQTQYEAKHKLGLDINNLRENDIAGNIDIINYEQLEKINVSRYGAVVLDESSILKNYSGKTRNEIISMFSRFKYKLACTATPAPNDYMELGNHCEFMGVMSRNEMLSMYFIHDGGETAKWRLKRHAEDKFWKFVASWAAIFTKPSDLGYSDDGFILPPLVYNPIIVKSEYIPEGHLFSVDAKTLNERRGARRESTEGRAKIASEIVNKSNDIFLVWCDLNYESDILQKLIFGSVEVKGSDSMEHKEKSMIDFSQGKIKCLVTKPSIAGFGMNFQVCHNEIFVGLSDSFEQYFQAVRRCWRFGQKKQVNVWIVYSESEGAVIENIKRKERDAESMITGMVDHTRKYIIENIKTRHNYRIKNDHNKPMEVPSWM